jgi:hypothetical protein
MVSKLNYWNKMKLSTGQILLVMGLATFGVVTGIIPEYDGQHQTIKIENKAFAQTPSDADLRRYAQAAIEIERLRQATFTSLENMISQEQTSQLACHQPDSINQLPSNARTLVMDYCRSSEGIVKKYGLSNSQFNQITNQVRQNSDLRNRLRNITRSLQ